MRTNASRRIPHIITFITNIAIQRTPAHFNLIKLLFIFVFKVTYIATIILSQFFNMHHLSNGIFRSVNNFFSPMHITQYL